MMDAVLSWLPLQALAVAAAPAAGPSIPVVVVTGIILVFLILVLLTLILVGEGKLFEKLDKTKKQKGEPGDKALPQQSRPAAAPAPAPVVEAGIPPEVVAAIAAAVNEIENGRYTLRSVSARPKGRGEWGLAGVLSYTEPF